MMQVGASMDAVDILLRLGRKELLQATVGAANDGAATRAAAPCSRGCSLAATRRISVSAAAGVNALSARAVRSGNSIRSQASVISPPIYTRAGSRALMTDARPSPR